MLLIFEQYRTPFGEKLYKATKRMGLTSLWLTPDDIVKNLLISFYLNNNETKINFSYKSLNFKDSDIDGIYSAIDYFPEDLFEFFSEKDKNYAVMEWYALWLSLLTSIKEKVLNPPAVDTIGGATFTPLELFNKARLCGLDTPSIIEVESGEIASQFTKNKAHLAYVDLGKEMLIEKKFETKELLQNPLIKHHIRIREYLPYKMLRITIIGSEIFLNYTDKKDTHLKIPNSVLKNLLKLHKEINLIIAEYSFSIKEKEWIVYDVKRVPSPISLDTHGDRLINKTIQLIQRGK